MLVMFNPALPVFEKIRVVAALVVPVRSSMKAIAFEDRFNGATPVPERLTVLPAELLVIVSWPERGPPTVGAKRTLMMQLCPAGIPWRLTGIGLRKFSGHDHRTDQQNCRSVRSE
jgi:hypothetical protein